jgi:hypothetical protein
VAISSENIERRPFYEAAARFPGELKVLKREEIQ